MWFIVNTNGVFDEPLDLFHKMSFGRVNVTVSEVQDDVIGDGSSAADAVEPQDVQKLLTDLSSPLHVLLIQLGCTYGAYIFAKFACKVQIQGFRYPYAV